MYGTTSPGSVFKVPGSVFKVRLLCRQYRGEKSGGVGTVSSRVFPKIVAPYSSCWSNRALKFVPGGARSISRDRKVP